MGPYGQIPINSLMQNYAAMQPRSNALMFDASKMPIEQPIVDERSHGYPVMPEDRGANVPSHLLRDFMDIAKAAGVGVIDPMGIPSALMRRSGIGPLEHYGRRMQELRNDWPMVADFAGAAVPIYGGFAAAGRLTSDAVAAKLIAPTVAAMTAQSQIRDIARSDRESPRAQAGYPVGGAY